MILDKGEIKNKLMEIFRQQVPPLMITAETDKALELSGTKAAMQGSKKVDNYYFGTVMEKSKGTRLYFFPIYTHPIEFEHISTELRNTMKGNNCFQINRLDDTLEAEIKAMIEKGVKVYQEADLI